LPSDERLAADSLIRDQQAEPPGPTIAAKTPTRIKGDIFRRSDFGKFKHGINRVIGRSSEERMARLRDKDGSPDAPYRGILLLASQRDDTVRSTKNVPSHALEVGVCEGRVCHWSVHAVQRLRPKQRNVMRCDIIGNVMVHYFLCPSEGDEARVFL
jgi:hypothetical protein